MKALEILKVGIKLMNEELERNPATKDYIDNEIKVYQESIKELEDLQNRSCESCSTDYIKCKIFIAYWKKTESSCIADSKCFYCNRYKAKGE